MTTPDLPGVRSSLVRLPTHEECPRSLGLPQCLVSSPFWVQFNPPIFVQNSKENVSKKYARRQ